jgi:predicted RNase H-like nuclease
MLQGEALYRQLEASHPLLAALPPAGHPPSAAHKRSQRTELLRQAGIDPVPLTSTDFIDAALCALAAQHLASGLPCRAYGEAGSGLIVVPQGPAAAELPPWSEQVPDWSDWTA